MLQGVIRFDQGVFRGEGVQQREFSPLNMWKKLVLLHQELSPISLQGPCIADPISRRFACLYRTFSDHLVQARPFSDASSRAGCVRRSRGLQVVPNIEVVLCIRQFFGRRCTRPSLYLSFKHSGWFARDGSARARCTGAGFYVGRISV